MVRQGTDGYQFSVTVALGGHGRRRFSSWLAGASSGPVLAFLAFYGEDQESPTRRPKVFIRHRPVEHDSQSVYKSRWTQTAQLTKGQDHDELNSTTAPQLPPTKPRRQKSIGCLCRCTVSGEGKIHCYDTREDRSGLSDRSGGKRHGTEPNKKLEGVDSGDNVLRADPIPFGNRPPLHRAYSRPYAFIVSTPLIFHLHNRATSPTVPPVSSPPP